MKKFWFFDLDGTLADTDADIRLAWKSAMTDLALDCPEFDEKFVAGPPIEEMARVLFPGRFTDELAAGIRARFGFHYDSDGFPCTREFPGVMDAVRSLKASGGRVFIVTNKRYAGAMAMARKFAWTEVFEEVYAGDMYMSDPAVGKLTKGELLDRVIRFYGADRSDCVMVGDTMSDFKAARDNGIESVGVAWGYGGADELSASDRIVYAPSELIADEKS